MSAINEVNPFKSLRYDKNVVNDIGLCLSPPYDIVSPLMQKYYYDLHEYNVIRLILGKEYSTDNNQSRFIVINMCDSDQSDYQKVLSALKKRFGRQIFAITSPKIQTKQAVEKQQITIQ